MYVTKNDDFGDVRERFGVAAVNLEVTSVGSRSMDVVGGVELSFKSGRDSFGNKAERVEKPAALHDPFPRRSRPQQVSVDRVNLDAFGFDRERIGEKSAAEHLFIKRAEPEIVISRDDRERSAAIDEIACRREPRAHTKIEPALPRREPKVAQVADDDQRIASVERFNQCGESTRPFGSIDS